MAGWMAVWRAVRRAANSAVRRDARKVDQWAMHSVDSTVAMRAGNWAGAKDVRSVETKVAATVAKSAERRAFVGVGCWVASMVYVSAGLRDVSRVARSAAATDA